MKKTSLLIIIIFILSIFNPVINNTAYSMENDIIIDELYLTDEKIKLSNDYIEYQLDNNNRFIMARNIAVISGSFFIPGVGQAIITVAGTIVVLGAIIATGSWLYKKITVWVYYSKKNSADNAISKIPSSLKNRNGNVNVGRFTKKTRGKQEWKDPKTGWSIEKDTSGHRGYDRSIKKWKIKDKKGKRIGSLNSNGKVIDK
ncbi:MAG: hypothetical protein ACRCZK_02415 [Oscillospiraceae bacterium]